MSVDSEDGGHGQMTWFRLSGLATFVEGRGVTRGLGVPCPALPCGCGDLKHEAEFGARHFTKVTGLACVNFDFHDLGAKLKPYDALEVGPDG